MEATVEFLWLSSFGVITNDTQTVQAVKRKAKEPLKTCISTFKMKPLIILSLKLPVLLKCLFIYQRLQTQLFVCVYYQQSAMLAGPCRGSFKRVSSGQLAFWYTLCFVAQAPVQISNIWKRDREEKYDFLSYHDSLQYIKAVLLEFPG